MIRGSRRRRFVVFLLGAAPLALAVPMVADAQSSTKTYTYDALGRLVIAKTTGGSNNNETHSLCYDKSGNRTSYGSTSNGSSAACVSASVGTPSPTSTPTPSPTPTSTPTPIPVPSISVGNGSSTEGGSLGFVVTLSAASSSNINVNYATAYGSAGSSDFTATSGTLTFSARQTSKIVYVSIKKDYLLEPSEIFTLNLSNATGGTTISDSQGIGTILDDDDCGVSCQ